MSDEKDGCDHPDGDFVIPGPPLPSGDRMCLVHKSGHELEPAVLHHARDGEPLPDDAVLVTPRDGTPYYDIGESVAELRKGPSRVATRAYRDGFDRVFGKKAEVGQA